MTETKQQHTKTIAATLILRTGRFNVIENSDVRSGAVSYTIRRVENRDLAESCEHGRIEGHASTFGGACGMVAYIAKINHQQPKEPGQL